MVCHPTKNLPGLVTAPKPTKTTKTLIADGQLVNDLGLDSETQCNWQKPIGCFSFDFPPSRWPSVLIRCCFPLYTCSPFSFYLRSSHCTHPTTPLFDCLYAPLTQKALGGGALGFIATMLLFHNPLLCVFHFVNSLEILQLSPSLSLFVRN